MNHELVHNTLSEPVLGEPLNRGPIVSKLVLDRKGKVLSGERAYDTVYLDDTLVGPAPTAANTTPSFTRFCSASLAGREEGFDRSIYFANEESGGASTFDGKGGLAVAVFDNEAHGAARPRPLRLGERARPARHRQVHGDHEHGGRPCEPGSLAGQQPALHVRRRQGSEQGRDRARAQRARRRNAVRLPLEGPGEEQRVDLPQRHDRRRVGLARQRDALSDVQLEAASDAANAMIFARPEDGAFNLTNNDQYFFVTTGEGTGNGLGRLYSLELTGKDSTGPARLTVAYNADQVIAAGGDIAISPDNIDVSRDYLMINEDGTTTSRAVMASKKRDGSIWRFDVDRTASTSHRRSALPS